MPHNRRRSPVAAAGDGPRPRSGRHRWRGAASPARRLVRGLLVVAAGTAALALAGPLALRPFADAAGAAGEVGVAFVLDFGGTPADLVVGCVTVPAPDSRYDALSAFAASRGLAPPTYAPSGLLCSINGTPASGCGQTVPGGYVYWSYFTGGSGTWTYASTGAFATVGPNDVEGWRFQDPGSGRPNDPPPRSPAQYAAVCPPTPATTTTTTVPAATGTGASAPTTGASTTTTAAAATGRPAGPAGPAAGGGSHPTTSVPGGPTGPAAAGSSTSGPPGPGGAGAASGPSTRAPAVGVASVTRHGAPGTGPWPAVVGGLLVAGLALVAWLRWRTRLRTP